MALLSNLTVRGGVLFAAGVSAPLIYSLAALWAVAAPVSWHWRWGPLILLLAGMAPIGASELLALFGTQTAIVAGFLLTYRAWRSHLRHSEAREDVGEILQPVAASKSFQFGLPDLLRLMVLAGCVLSMIQIGQENSAMADGMPTEWWRWIVIGVVLAVNTLVIRGFAASTRFRLFWVVPALGLSGGSGYLLHWMLFKPQPLGLGTEFGIPLRWCVALGVGYGILCTFVFVLLTRLGWCWPNALQRTGNLNTIAQAFGSLADAWKRSRTAGTGLVLIVLAAAGSTLALYCKLLPPPIPEHLRDPGISPNGYEALFAAAAKLDWAHVAEEDYDAATTIGLTDFRMANAQTLNRARAALAIPCRRPTRYTFSGFNLSLNEIQAARSLSRAFVAEGRSFAAEGAHSVAASSYLDILRLGPAISAGGFMVDDLVAIAVEACSVSELAPCLGKLDSADLALVIERLKPSLNSRESYELIMEREHIWSARAYGWFGRLEEEMDAVQGSQNFNEDAYFAARKRCETRKALLVAAAAVRRFELIEGAPPTSLPALVPAYLSFVPRDPYGDGPLTYRRTPEGHVLYSVAANHRDDGGERVTVYQAVYERKGDLFLDAKFDDEDSSATPTAESVENDAQLPKADVMP